MKRITISNELVDCALNGDSAALEQLLTSVQDLIFNLSLRMLGTVQDAEDATQDILIKVMTNLSAFRKESNYFTWVYRIVVNHLISYKKNMFAQYPLSFEYYGNDIAAGSIENTDDLFNQVSKEILADELKMSCTNVMLQCLDTQQRIIFILGAMFRLDSQIAGEILEMKPDTFRQKLLRVRRNMAGFLSYYCGLTETGYCSCENRIGYAIKHNRINPDLLDYTKLEKQDLTNVSACKTEMENLDELAIQFTELPLYKSKVSAKAFIEDLLNSSPLNIIKNLQ